MSHPFFNHAFLCSNNTARTHSGRTRTDSELWTCSTRKFNWWFLVWLLVRRVQVSQLKACHILMKSSNIPKGYRDFLFGWLPFALHISLANLRSSGQQYSRRHQTQAFHFPLRLSSEAYPPLFSEFELKLPKWKTCVMSLGHWLLPRLIRTTDLGEGQIAKGYARKTSIHCSTCNYFWALYKSTLFLKVNHGRKSKCGQNIW